VIPALLGVICRVVKNSHVIAVFCRNAGLKKDVQCLRLRLAFNPLLERMVPLCVLRDPPLEGAAVADSFGVDAHVPPSVLRGGVVNTS